MSADLKPKAGAGERDAVRTPESAPAPAPDMPGSYDPATQATDDEQGTLSEPAAIDEVLDVEGATRLLRIGRNTIYELVGRNEIPHRRLGKQIRFSRAAIMRWLDPWSSQGAKKGQ
jgi:excisionase family DNA binding protein